MIYMTLMPFVFGLLCVFVEFYMCQAMAGHTQPNKTMQPI